MSSSLSADGLPLMHVPVEGGSPITVTREIMLPHRDFLAWSPDGQHLALVEGGNRSSWENKAIATATFSSDLRYLSDSNTADVFPAWSPDGRWIALTRGPAATKVGGGDEAKHALSQHRIWLLAADGSAKRQLTNDADFRDERPLWSIDGSTILFARLQGEEAQLWLMRADGSEKRRVVNELAPNLGWFGYYGYLDWGRLYDWWSGLPMAK